MGIGKNCFQSNNNKCYLLCAYYVLCSVKSFIVITSLRLTELDIINPLLEVTLPLQEVAVVVNISCFCSLYLQSPFICTSCPQTGLLLPIPPHPPSAWLHAWPVSPFYSSAQGNWLWIAPDKSVQYSSALEFFLELWRKKCSLSNGETRQNVGLLLLPQLGAWKWLQM